MNTIETATYEAHLVIISATHDAKELSEMVLTTETAATLRHHTTIILEALDKAECG